MGKLKVDKKSPVWDNTYGAEAPVDEDGNPIAVNEYSLLKGGSKYQPGLHYIRLIK